MINEIDECKFQPVVQRRFSRLGRRKFSDSMRVVGNYKISGKLGEGASAHVYKAYRIGDEKKLAVKILPKASENIEKLRNEVKILQSVKHENIIKIQQVIEEENKMFIFMEYYPKGDLFHFIESRGLLSEQMGLKIFIKIFDALLYLHENGITHRDIKSENILLDQQYNPKLTDFGFAQFYDKSNPILQSFCGTFQYMAPEMLKKKKYQPELVDVWSMGVLLYVLLTGFQPFGHQDRIAIKYSIVNFKWNKDANLSKQAFQLLDLIFVPAQHRITLKQMKQTSIFRKYGKENEENPNNRVLETDPNTQKTRQLLIKQRRKEMGNRKNEVSKQHFSQFPSERLQRQSKQQYSIPNKKIELIKMIRLSKQKILHKNYPLFDRTRANKSSIDKYFVPDF